MIRLGGVPADPSAVELRWLEMSRMVIPRGMQAEDLLV